MMKTLLGLFVAGTLFVGSSASALNYTFTDSNPTFINLNDCNTSYTGQFNITPAYNPLTMQVNSATAKFTLGDLFGSEGYNITMEGSAFVSGGSFFGLINVGGGVGSLLGNLSADGILNYTITRTSGEFWVLNACLTAYASDRTTGGVNNTDNRVPDGGLTIALLGMGFICLGAMKRKLI